MKVFLFLFILTFGFALSLQANPAKPFHIVIDKHTTRQALDNLIQHAKTKNVKLIIEEATYTHSGSLRKIKGRVEFESGEGSFTSARVGRIEITHNPEGPDSGFTIEVQNSWF